jgi:hypothetical protein
MIAGLAIIGLAVGAFIGFVLMDHDSRLRMPVWVTFAAVVGTLMLAIIAWVVSDSFTWHATSVFVYRTREGGFYYEFWSADYQEYLKEGGTGEKVLSAPSQHL